MARSIRQKTNDVADAGLDGIEDMVSTARSTKNKADRRFGRKLDNAQDSMESMAEDVGRQLRDTYESSREYIEETTQAARKTVARNPLMALGAAFVGGLLASAILRR